MKTLFDAGIMRPRCIAIAGLALSLLWVGASAADLKWPGHGKDPYPWPEGNDAYKIIGDRFSNASVSPLGSKEDLAAITKAVVTHMKHPKAKVEEIRWLSPSLVMVASGWYSGPLAAAGYYYVVERTKEGWTVQTYYMLVVS